MSFTEWGVLLIMVAIICLYLKRFYSEVEYVKSDVDGRSYLVRALGDRQAAADMLARLNATLTRLVHHMVAKYPSDEGVKQLFENYSPDALSEGGNEVGYTSYSVNKKQLVMCVRHPNRAFVDFNVLTYVAVHELGHFMTDEVGHTDKFWANFRRLLEEAMSMGIYTKIDYASNPQPYCGIKIASSVV